MLQNKINHAIKQWLFFSWRLSAFLSRSLFPVIRMMATAFRPLMLFPYIWTAWLSLSLRGYVSIFFWENRLRRRRKKRWRGGTGGGGAGAEKVKQAISFAPHFPNSFGSRNISYSFPRTESRVWVLRPKEKRTVETNDDTGTGWGSIFLPNCCHPILWRIFSPSITHLSGELLIPFLLPKI